MAEAVDEGEAIVTLLRPLVTPAEHTQGDPSCIPVVRFRPPFIGTSAHDARADAVQLVAENLVQRGLPNNISHLVAQKFVDVHEGDDQLRTERVPFKSDVYDSIDASVWCRRVVAAIPSFLERVVSGDVKIRGLPDSYNQYPFSYCGDKNRRPKMEDRHMCIPTMQILGRPDDGTGIFGVFDGHGGTEVASYAASHMPEIFSESEGTLEERLRDSMHQLDCRVTARCEKEHWKSGSTAICLAVNQDQLCFGWVGDSSGYLFRSTEVEKISEEHNPSNESEARRVEAAGGMLVWIQGEYRVNGILNLTRSYGDVMGRPMIISDADLRRVDRDGGEYLAILACDGVADSLTETEIYETIEKFIREHPPRDYNGLAAALCAAAKEEGSSDNLSAVVVFLKTPEELWKLFSADD